MITSEGLRRLADSHEGRLLIDTEGRVLDVPGLADDAHIPGLLVAPVTEAVKLVESDDVVRHVSRDTLWTVQGFLLDRAIVDGLGEGIRSASDLMTAVRNSGHEWRVVGRD